MDQLLLIAVLIGVVGLVVGLADAHVSPGVQQALKWIGMLFAIGVMVSAVGGVLLGAGSSLWAISLGMLVIGLSICGFSLLLVPMVGLVAGLSLLFMAPNSGDVARSRAPVVPKSPSPPVHPNPEKVRPGMMPTHTRRQGPPRDRRTLTNGRTSSPTSTWQSEQVQQPEPGSASYDGWLGEWECVEPEDSPGVVGEAESGQTVEPPAVTGVAVGDRYGAGEEGHAN